MYATKNNLTPLKEKLITKLFLTTEHRPGAQNSIGVEGRWGGGGKTWIFVIKKKINVFPFFEFSTRTPTITLVHVGASKCLKRTSIISGNCVLVNFHVTLPVMSYNKCTIVQVYAQVVLGEICSRVQATLQVTLSVSPSVCWSVKLLTFLSKSYCITALWTETAPICAKFWILRCRFF